MNKRTKQISALLFVMLLLCSAFSMQFMTGAASATHQAQITNVIFMIGDGMGENHLKLAVQEGYTLFMDDNADVRGQSKTRSVLPVTDSAAGATALSSGVRNINGCLGTYFFDPFGWFVRPRSITEHAIAKGMKTGIVTTDKTTGATPAGFSTHVVNRNLPKSITAQQLDCEIDLIWGAAVDGTDRACVEAKGFRYLATKAEMNALSPGSRSFGQFNGDLWRPSLPADDQTPTLQEMTVKAISLLNAENENGFFLMVEGAHIDKHSHKTDHGADYPEKVADTANAVKGFDNAIKAAVEFARKDGNTLVVVTADHETGALSMDNGRYTFHSGSHSAANVPVLVYGCDDLIPEGEVVDNKSLPKRVAKKLGWSAEEFPETDAGAVILWLKNLFSSQACRLD